MIDGRDVHSRTPCASLFLRVSIWAHSLKAGRARVKVVYFQDDPEKQEGDWGEGKADIRKWMLPATGAQPHALRDTPPKGRRLECLFTSSVLSTSG